ncbi:class I SAM-dependent methyltransferase [Candidatus Bathyarchaeota archaeon]|nr:class I SAM-dependent methyltransferase [Candidatus Bathyarchaeota archaeon]
MRFMFISCFFFPITFGKTSIPNQNPYNTEVIFDLTSQTRSAVCEPGTCDTFQFMAKTLKMKVLHPGGLHATKLLAEKCKISSDMIILDAGCGSGRSDIFIANKYGCRIVGVDIETENLLKAQTEAVSSGLGDRVVFRPGNVNALSFQDQTFDGAIFQAALIFTNKTEALQSVYQKVRSGGFLGVIELAWKKPPTENIVTKVRETLCAAAINTETHSDWIHLFRKNGFEVTHSELLDHKFNFRGMFENEGLLSSLRIALKCINDESVKKKMGQIKSLFKETGEYLGYGIYAARKK